MNITEFRAQHPEYADMGDDHLADSLYQKHYSDMPREQFEAGFRPAPPHVATSEERVSALVENYLHPRIIPAPESNATIRARRPDDDRRPFENAPSDEQGYEAAFGRDTWQALSRLVSGENDKLSDQERAKAANIMAISGMFQMSPAFVHDNYEAINKQIGIQELPPPHEAIPQMIMMGGGLASAGTVPIWRMALGIVGYEAEERINQLIRSHIEGKPYSSVKPYGLYDLAPDDASEGLKTVLGLADLAAKGKAVHTGFNGLGRAWDALATDGLNMVLPSETVFIPAEHLAENPDMVPDLVQSGILSPDQVELAKKYGVDVAVPHRKIIGRVDAPWWGEVKSKLKLTPYDEAFQINLGETKARPHVSGEIEAPESGSDDARYESGGGSPPDAPETMSLTLQGRTAQAMAFFQAQGWSREQAAGIVGNLLIEDPDLSPGTIEKGSGKGYGLAQHTGPRRTALFGFAEGLGEKEPSFYTELKFIQHELKTSEAGAAERLRGAKSVEDAARAFSEGFERPGVPAIGKRIARAGQAFEGTPFQKQLHQAIIENPNLPAEQKTAMLQTMDERAMSWAQRENSTPEEWYSRYVADMDAPQVGDSTWDKVLDLLHPNQRGNIIFMSKGPGKGDITTGQSPETPEGGARSAREEWNRARIDDRRGYLLRITDGDAHAVEFYATDQKKFVKQFNNAYQELWKKRVDAVPEGKHRERRLASEIPPQTNLQVPSSVPNRWNRVANYNYGQDVSLPIYTVKSVFADKGRMAWEHSLGTIEQEMKLDGITSDLADAANRTIDEEIKQKVRNGLRIVRNEEGDPSFRPSISPEDGEQNIARQIMAGKELEKSKAVLTKDDLRDPKVKRDFNRLLKMLGGKSLNRKDVASRTLYKKRLSKPQLSAYYRAYSLWDEHGGNVEAINAALSAEGNVLNVLTGKLVKLPPKFGGIKFDNKDEAAAKVERIIEDASRRSSNPVYEMNKEYDRAVFEESDDPYSPIQAEAARRAATEIKETERTRLAKIEKELRRQVKDSFQGEKAYAMVRSLIKGRGISLPGLREDYDADTVQQLMKRYPRLFREKNGMSPDEVGQLYDYENADDLVENLKYLPTKKAYIEKFVTEGVRAYAPELELTEVERQQVFVEKELEVMRESLPTPRQEEIIAGQYGVNMNPRTAKGMRNIIDKQTGITIADASVKTDHDNLKAALLREQRAAAKAYRAGRIDEAIARKQAQAQLLDRLKTEIAERQAIGKLRAKINKIAGSKATYSTTVIEDGKEKTIRARVPIDYRKQIAGILKSLDWPGTDKINIQEPEPLFDFLARKQQETGEVFKADFSDLASLFGKGYHALTLDALNSIHECLNELVHKGKEEGFVTIAGQRMELNTLAQGMANAIVGAHRPNLQTADPKAAIPYDEPKGKLERLRLMLRNWNITLQEVETFAEWCDGFPEKLGPNWRGLYNPVNEAVNALNIAMKDLDVMHGAFKQFGDWKGDIGPWSNKRFSPPALDGKFIRKYQILGLAQHYGNPGNRNEIFSTLKFLFRRDFTEDDLQQILSILTPQEWDAVTETMRIRNNPTRNAQLAQAYRNDTGNEFTFVELPEVTLPDGRTVPGWHAMLKDDPDASYQMEQRHAMNENRDLSRGSINHSRGGINPRIFDKRREGAKHILDLNFFQTEAGTIADTLSYIYLTDAGKNAQKIINHPYFRQAVEGYIGKEYHRMLLPWLQDQLRPMSETMNAVTGMVDKVRQAGAYVHLGFKIMTAIKHIPQVLMITEASSEKWVMNALFNSEYGVLTRPGKAREFIESKSDYMAAHVLKAGDRDVAELLLNFDPERSYTREQFIKASLIPIETAIGFLSRTAFMAEYHRWLLATGSEEEALMYAHKIVRDTVGSYDPKDLSKIRRDGKYSKLFTMFTTVPAALYQRYFRAAWKAFGPDQGNFAKRAGGLLRSLAYTVIALGVIDAVLKKRRSVSPGEAAEGVALGIGHATLPIIGDAIEAGIEGYRYELSPVGEPFGDMAEVIKALRSDKPFNRHTFEAGLTALGYFLKLPTDAIGTAAEGAYGLSKGDPNYHAWNLLVKPPSPEHAQHGRGRGRMRINFR